jgi:hypothetical protein
MAIFEAGPVLIKEAEQFNKYKPLSGLQKINHVNMSKKIEPCLKGMAFLFI